MDIFFVVIPVLLALIGAISFQGAFGFIGAFVVVSIALPLAVGAIVVIIAAIARK